MACVGTSLRTHLPVGRSSVQACRICRSSLSYDQRLHPARKCGKQATSMPTQTTVFLQPFAAERPAGRINLAPFADNSRTLRFDALTMPATPLAPPSPRHTTQPPRLWVGRHYPRVTGQKPATFCRYLTSCEARRRILGCARSPRRTPEDFEKRSFFPSSDLFPCLNRRPPPRCSPRSLPSCAPPSIRNSMPVKRLRPFPRPTSTAVCSSGPNGCS